MANREGSAQGLSSTNLSIGDLAQQTGLSTAVLRTWETRHGFPRPTRLDSGHRRYSQDDVESVRTVLRRREAGVRLEVAIADAAGFQSRPFTQSVYAELRRHDPRLKSYRWRKSTMLALTWAIEDECCALAQRANLFGAFQKERYYRRSRLRWNELARVSHSTMAFAEFDAAEMPDERATRVPLPEDSPMRREWVVVCDAPDLPVALAAFELAGQDDVPDRERVFESVWTVDALPVRHAARVCAGVAVSVGVAGATELVEHLAPDPRPATGQPSETSALFGRVLSYADQLAGGQPLTRAPLTR